MQWVQITCTSVLCTTSTGRLLPARKGTSANSDGPDPTLFACADANCNQARTVRVGQCATYSTGVWAFWQRESTTAGVGTGTWPAPAPAPAPVNPFIPPLGGSDDQDASDGAGDNE